MERSRPRVLAAAVATLTTALAIVPAAHAQAPADSTAPTLDAATLTPLGPAQYGGVRSGVEQVVNGTGIGTWYTTTGGVQIQMSATDDVGVDKFQYRLGTTGDYIDVPATPQGGASATGVTPTITAEGNNTYSYRALDAAGNASAVRTVRVPIDTQPPSATFTGVSNNHVGHSQTINPTRTDPTPGSGGTAVRDTWLDGQWVYPLPLDASKLSLGRHTWTLGLSDGAGNGNKVTQTFVVTTSFADLDAMLTRYQTDGTIAAATVTDLRSKLSAASSANDNMDKLAALASLGAFADQARGIGGDAGNLLVGDSLDVARQVSGVPDAPDPSDLGVTSERYPGPPQHLYKAPTGSTNFPNATFKVLVIGPKNDGSYRHESIEDAEEMIQKLGQQYGFNVDYWDAVHPSPVSLPDTPFTSAANLAQYKVIIGDSSVGNNTFNAAYTMKDGTTVNEQAAFQGYIENGGGYVSLHGADDSMHNWQWYKDMLGGLFVSHPSNQSGFAPNCGSCYNAELQVEDPSNPAIAGAPRTIRIADELYHFDRKPRPYGHPILLLNESTYATAMGVNSRNALENGDHPISWCTNYDGGRVFANVLGHNYDLFTTPWFVNYMRHAIMWAAGQENMNCVTHREVQSLIAADQAAGTLTPSAASAASAAVQSAMDKYMTLTAAGYSGSLNDIASLHSIAQDPTSGDGAARATLAAKAQQLRDWMLVLLGATSQSGGVGGNVPATLSLTLGTPASFGPFTPGAAKDYTASTNADVISTAGDATLSVADPSATATGHLVNGTFSLPQALQARARNASNTGTAFNNVGSSSSPLNLLTYDGPVSNDAVALEFKQSIGANDALRTGTYNKTLTFTLSTATP